MRGKQNSGLGACRQTTARAHNAGGTMHLIVGKASVNYCTRHEQSDQISPGEIRRSITAKLFIDVNRKSYCF